MPAILDNIDNLVCHFEDIVSLTGELSAEEASYVCNASVKRRREFLAGRVLARRALLGLGVECHSLPASVNRYPIWPSGYVGSISHTDTQVVTAVTSVGTHRGLGIDLENTHAVGDDLFDFVLTRGEQDEVMNGSSTELATAIFSCKESVFKAVFPLFHEFLEFSEVEVTIDGERFTANCLCDKKSARSIKTGVGYITRQNGAVISLFLLR